MNGENRIILNSLIVDLVEWHGLEIFLNSINKILTEFATWNDIGMGMLEYLNQYKLNNAITFSLKKNGLS